MKHALKYGKKVAVIRPSDPAKALRIAEECLASKDSERFDNLPAEVGEYTFVGYLAENGLKVLDDRGKAVGTLKPGDSFVDPEGLTTVNPLN